MAVLVVAVVRQAIPKIDISSDIIIISSSISSSKVNEDHRRCRWCYGYSGYNVLLK